MASSRSQLASLLLSLSLHASLIALAAGIAYSIAQPRSAIRVTLLPGGGGADAGASEPAPAGRLPAPAPQAEAARPIEEPKPVAKPAVRMPRKPVREQAPSVAPPAEPAVAAVQPAAGAGSGPAPGAGTGSGGGSGSGDGAGEGPNRGAGRDVDLRLFCVSCPEPPYPRLARARGWQGATDVELTVLADGRVDTAAIARSSGFEVLDTAALEVARRSRFTPPPAGLSPPVKGLLAYRFEIRKR